MSLEKFIHLIATKTLFFCRVDRLGDPFEGSITLKDSSRRVFARKLMEDEHASGHLQGEIESLENEALWLSETATFFRRSFNASCWHANAAESAAMWTLYGEKRRAIAITSTCERLRDVLPDNTVVGKVRYADYENDHTPQSGFESSFLQKRSSFSHESEVRALFLEPTTDRYDDIGFGVPISLDALIEDVRIAPGSSPLFRDVVERIMEAFKLEKELCPSQLDEVPLF